MQTVKLLLATLCALTVLMGCTPMSVERISDREWPATEPEAIVVYRRVEDVPTPYERIAILHAQEPFTFTDDEPAILRLARKKASALGANGLVVGAFHDPTNRVIDLSIPTPFARKSDVYAPPPPSMDPATAERWTDILAVRTGP